MKALLIALLIIVLAFNTAVSVVAVLIYFAACHAGLTIGPPFNGFGKC